MQQLGYHNVIGFAVVYPFKYSEDEITELNKKSVALLSQSENNNLDVLLTEKDLEMLQTLKKVGFP